LSGVEVLACLQRAVVWQIYQVSIYHLGTLLTTKYYSTYHAVQSRRTRSLKFLGDWHQGAARGFWRLGFQCSDTIVKWKEGSVIPRSSKGGQEQAEVRRSEMEHIAPVQLVPRKPNSRRGKLQIIPPTRITIPTDLTASR